MIKSRNRSDQTESVFNPPATLPQYPWTKHKDPTVKTNEGLDQTCQVLAYSLTSYN